MIELKTLKDLGREFISHTGKKTLNRVDIEELKTEAIKWVKYYQKKKFIDDESAQWLRMWIIKFFNLTEADLYPKGHEIESKGGKKK